MQKKHQLSAGLVLLVLALLPAGATAAQTQQPRPAASPAANEEQLSSTREELFKLLRLSPKLTSVVARDPSLLGNQDYVAHNNPELAQFLQQHPEVARNPEFYLFANSWGPGNREQRLERVVWPDLPYLARDNTSDYLAFLVFLCLLSAAVWLFRVLLENRRWGRILKLQSDVHAKLLDKFSSSQELLTYMNTEAGRRFLEASPIPAGFAAGSPAKMSLMRVLAPLQLGVVLTLVGAGFFFLRDSRIGAEGPFLVLGTLGLTLGIGFIISSGLSYVLARHMGLLAQSTAEVEKSANIAARQL